MKNAVKKLLPEPVRRELRRCRSYGSAELALYLKLRFLHGTGMVKPHLSRPPNSARSFLFVCHGNIMRSPMCEALMNQACVDLHQGVSVTSAGLNAIPGTEAHPWAVSAARDYGISLEQHRSRLLTDEMVERAEVVFAMDYQNQVQLISRWPNAKQKVYLLSAYADEHYKSVEIHDPYLVGEQATRDCYRVLDACIRNLRSTLS